MTEEIKISKSNSAFWFGLKANKDIAFYLLISSATTNFLTLAIPIVLLQIYDRVIGKQSYHSLLWLIIGATVAIILEMVVKISRSKICQISASFFELKLSEHMFKSIIHGSFRSIQKINSDVFMQAFSAISKIREIYSGKCYQVLIDLPFSILFWWVIYRINKPVAYYLLVLYSSYFLIILVVRTISGGVKNRKIEKDKQRTSFFIEVLSNMMTSKSMGFENKMIRKNDSTQKEYSQSNYLAGVIETIPELLGNLYSQLSLFGVIGIGSYYVIKGNLTVGTLTACTLIGGRILSPIKGFISFLIKTKEYSILLEKIIEVCKIIPQREQQLPILPKSVEGRLTLENVTYSDKDNKILEECNLEFPSKKMSVVESYDETMDSIMPHLFMGHYELGKGHVYIDHYDIMKFNEENHHVISYVSSKTVLFSGTMLENLTLFDSQKNDLAYDCAALMELDRFISDLPQGYETKVDSFSHHLFPISILTKISLARTLVNHPSIYIFENIEKSLDKDSYSLFVWFLKKIKGIKTVIIFTTDPKIIEMADLHYFFYDGNISSVNDNILNFG